MQTILSLRRQVLVTVLGIVVARLGLFIPLPGTADIHSFWAIAETGGFPPFAKGSVFCLGIFPYVSASAILLLASGLLPKLRTLRDGTSEQRRSFDRILVIGTVFIAALQAVGISLYLENNLVGWPHSVHTTGPLFHFLIVISTTTGTMLLVWLAHLITRHGIANGVSVLFIVHVFGDLVPGLHGQYLVATREYRLEATVLIFLVALVGAILFCVFFAHARRKIPLALKDPNPTEERAVDRRPGIPIRLNPMGTVPIQFAATVIGVPITIYGILSQDGPPLEVNPLSAWYLTATIVLVLVASFVYSSWVFNGRDLIERVRRYGYRLDPPNVDEPGVRWVEKAQEGLLVPGSVLLAILAVSGTILPELTGLLLGVAFLFGVPLLVATTVFSDVVRRVRLLRSEVMNDQEEWVAILETDTWLEVALAQDRLHPRGIEGLIYSTRVTSLAGTFGLWEVSRPVFPALVLYPRLGGGRMMLLVRDAEAEKAREILLELADPYPSSFS